MAQIDAAAALLSRAVADRYNRSFTGNTRPQRFSKNTRILFRSKLPRQRNGAPAHCVNYGLESIVEQASQGGGRWEFMSPGDCSRQTDCLRCCRIPLLSNTKAVWP
ncbi:hypothetical protein NDU88_002834 [Pleurodeles waltl]|uniref:Uncharacterized protein n=1 Tax=Pleurodeles waltl TaxID=8319 RepID=A0AAV7UAD5_PLEWA|nr:hypothetical protein NDU88_002834 [Pleurodeles waltl]